MKLEAAADSIAELETAARFIIQSQTGASVVKVKAIKEVRVETGLGLQDARLEVEHFIEHKRWSDNISKVLERFKAAQDEANTDHSTDVLSAVVTLLIAGKKIKAIKDTQYHGFRS